MFEFPPRCRFSAILLFAAIGWLSATDSHGGVVVLNNRTANEVAFSVVEENGQARRETLMPTSVKPLWVARKVGIAFDTSDGPRRYLLQTNSIHCFVTIDERLDLLGIRLPEPEDLELPTKPRPLAELGPVHSVPVMLLVDDEEPVRQPLWEKRLRERLAEASAITELHCGVRFEVVAVGTWDSDDKIHDFSKSLREFETRVNPAPARLAVGFTSQYSIVRGRTHLGGTRGGLHSHILIREWSQHITHTERMEVLLHELGHFLGAAHTTDKSSVMRPVLGDGLSHARSFRIGFDPVNTMIMSLLGEELRTRRVHSLRSLHREAKYQMLRGYLALEKQMPDDASTQQFISTLTGRSYARPEPVIHPQPLVDGTSAVVRAIAEAAQENHRLPEESGETSRPTGASRLTGDRLTEYYVRRGAAAASTLPSAVAAKSLVLGLGLTVGDSSTIRYSPLGRDLCQKVESYQQRRERLKVFGQPTMFQRRAVALRFFGAAATAALTGGTEAAESAGIHRQMSRGKYGGKFNFFELTGDFAGAVLGDRAYGGKISPADLAQSFRIADYLPDGSDAAEGMPWEQFSEQFGSAQDDRFHRQKAAIRQWILGLPGYRSP